MQSRYGSIFKIVTIALVLTSSGAYAQDPLLPIIPEPVYAKSGRDVFVVNETTTINYSPELKATGELLKEAFYAHVGAVPEFNKRGTIVFNRDSGIIILKLDSGLVKEKEGYHLSIQKSGIVITGHDEAGVFYGIQSLIQLFQAKKRGATVQTGEIRDYPRFNYRGMHLDVGRHIYPVAFLKRYIDLLATYKFNIFHWHLTEDQGWRIEIKKYPRLQSVAAWRDGTIIGHKKESPHTFDGVQYGGFYTQDQIREVVAYAAEKHVNVLPEIEMPGHASAALAAYPELGCTGGPYHTAQFWGVFDDVFCAGNEEVFQFMEDVLDEVVGLFPYGYVHIGGDESPKKNWKLCPKCQKRIKEEGLKDEHELQGYFMKRIERYLKTKNKKAIGWDEVLEGGVSKETTIMNWRGEAGGIAAAQQQYEVIMTPENILYFDYYQSLDQREPIASASYTPLSKVYAYEPVPASMTAGEAKYIKGVQAGVWTEYMAEEDHVEYMVFPRALALAEVAWSQKGRKDYPYFLKKVRNGEALLKKLEVNYFPYFDEIVSTINQSPGQPLTLSLETSLPDAEIRYTTDGSIPGLKSNKYQAPVVLNHTGKVQAAIFKDKKLQGRVFERSFLQHDGLQKKITLVNSPAGKYNPPAETLLNGFEGSHRFNDGQWLGFNGDNLEALIDLGEQKDISLIGINILNYPWQRMWAPKKLTFLVSADGKDFKEVYKQERFELNGINAVRAKIAATKARYIKVVGENVGRVPAGGYGEGEKAWLMADEIIIN